VNRAGRADRSARPAVSQRLEGSEDPVQDVEQVRGGAGVATIQETRDRAEQVPEQVAGTRDCGDVEVDLVQVDHQTEKVKVERTENEVEDAAGAGLLKDVDRRRECGVLDLREDRRTGDIRRRDGTGDSADRGQDAIDDLKLVIVATASVPAVPTIGIAIGPTCGAAVACCCVGDGDAANATLGAAMSRDVARTSPPKILRCIVLSSRFCGAILCVGSHLDGGQEPCRKRARAQTKRAGHTKPQSEARRHVRLLRGHARRGYVSERSIR
jgi:hypothetical protein